MTRLNIFYIFWRWTNAEYNMALNNHKGKQIRHSSYIVKTHFRKIAAKFWSEI